MSSKADYNNLLKDLKKLNKENIFKIYVPTLNRVVDFNPVTVQQQKILISTALESALNTMLFHIATTDMIKECCCEKDLDFYTLDKASILIGLRVNMLGYDVIGQSLKEGDDTSINIESHYNKFTKHILNKNILKEQKIEYNGISVVFQPPSIDIDVAVNRQSHKHIDKIIKDKRLNDTIAEVIIFEIVKYVKSITINDKHIVFDHTKVKELVEIVNAFPLNLSKAILRSIGKIKDFEEKFTLIKKDGEDINIVVDARFFNGE